MITTKEITINKKKYIKTTTDVERLDEENNPLPNLVQLDTGIFYFDAIDDLDHKHTYKEYTEILTEQALQEGTTA